MRKTLFLLTVALSSPSLQAYATTNNTTTNGNITTHVIKAKKPSNAHHIRKYHATAQREEPKAYFQKQDPSIASPESGIAAETAAVDDSKKYPWLNDVTGTMAFTTNYMFRGFSQTRNLPAVQGGITYSPFLGIYLNLWGSNVKFIDTSATLEIDTIAGIRNDIGENFSYDINIARYIYSGTNGLNYNEINSVFNYYFLQAAVSYSGNVYNTHKSGTYYEGGFNFDIPANYVFGFENISLLALLGHYSLPAAAGGSYNDKNVALSKKFKNYTVTAQWTGSNGQQHLGTIDDNVIVGTVAAEF